MSKPTPESKNISRKTFIKHSALAGAGLVLARPFNITANPLKAADKINIAVVGCGGRGRGIIFSNIPKIPSANLVAVCDIIQSRRERARDQFNLGYGKKIRAYENFYDLLENEELDAVALATPDFWHMRHAVDALEAGLHVYCEKAMSNNIEDARKMAKAMKKTGKLLQIGRQRRSNDRYLFTYQILLKQERMFGRLTHAIGQWNRSEIWTQQPKKGETFDINVLKKYGFESVDQLFNWRNYKELGGGVVSDLGSHQIDIFNWFLESFPHTIYATGNNSYFGLEQADTMATILEYETKNGPAIGIYENISNSRAIGVFERFIGDEGTFNISEGSENKIYRESSVSEEQWQPYIAKGYIANMANMEKYKDQVQGDSGIIETAPQVSYDINDISGMKKVYNMASHTAHLYNFVESVREEETLNYDAVESYKSEVCIYKIHEAINSGGAKIKIDESEYMI